MLEGSYGGRFFKNFFLLIILANNIYFEILQI